MSNTAPFQPAASWLDQPRAYSGVRTRRMIAFLVDYSIVLLLCIPAFFVVGLLGIVTFGLGWMLYAILFPLVALPYVSFTLGGRAQATPGMRLFDLRLERLDGERVDVGMGAAHSILFWVAVTLTSGFIVLLALFTPRKQLLQDLLLGTVVVRRS